MIDSADDEPKIVSANADLKADKLVGAVSMAECGDYSY